MTTSFLLPPLWLLIVIVGLPQIAETIYTPSLPDIAHAFAVPEAWVEYTLTIYLAGFALGTLVWGFLSDRFGRKSCLLMSLVIYLAGCLGCFFSPSIGWLMISRFIQAFGGSTGSVLGQAICRDAFHGLGRGKVYSAIGSALAFSPAIGPVIGGIIDQWYGWSSIFLLLTLLGALVFVATIWWLPETYRYHVVEQRTSVSTLLKRLITDKKVIGFGILVAACNGIQFSYYAEGSFYLINLLGLTPSWYGISFIGLALAGMTGGWISHQLHSNHASFVILQRGIKVVFVGALLFMLTIGALHTADICFSACIVTTIGCLMIMMTGIAMIIPNALALALEEYRYAIGAAASLFGFFYYVLISLFTMFMGMLHNGTLLPMPLYFFCIAALMVIVSRQLRSA